MTHLRMLAVLLLAVLSGAGLCSKAQETLSLEELFLIAESNSAWLRPSLTAVREADKAVSEARSAMLPDINLDLSASFIGDGFTTKRNFSDYQKAPIPHFGNGFSLSIEQPIYAGGAISGSIQLADLRSTVSRFESELSRDNIRLRLAGFYLDVYKFTNLRMVVDRNLTAARQILSEMQARFDHGTALYNDITRYELLISNFELELLRIDNTLSILNSNLVSIAGLPQGTVVVPDSTILSRALPSQSEAWWQQTSFDNSPALAVARNSVEISRRAEKIVKAQSLPHIGLRAEWNINGPILVEIPPVNRNLSYWYVGIGVKYNLSSLFKNNRSIARSRIATQRSEEQFEVAQDNLELDVREAHIRYLEAYEELKSRDKAVELATRNYSVTATRYSADMALITDLLDAANARIDAEQQLVNAHINIIYSYYKLLFISGLI